jgi:NitT/TauT family transport system substrate-binding protein
MRAIIALMLLAAFGRGALAAETVRIGLLHTLSPAPLYLAMARGYFAQEGLDAQFKFFEAAQPIAAAAVSGDIDVGITALTGGFFSLAGRGALKVIGGGLHEEKGFEGTALLASMAAFDAGLTSPAKLAGHSMGITQFGSSFHYMAGQVAAHEGVELKSITLRPLQTIGNMIAAVRTGQVDTTMAIASQAKPLDATGQAKIIAWVGDLVPYQITAVFAPSRMTADHEDALRRCRGLPCRVSAAGRRRKAASGRRDRCRSGRYREVRVHRRPGGVGEDPCWHRLLRCRWRARRA